MTRYEYKVVPAPNRGEKARGVKGTGDRFALALTTLMNSLGRDGWEYLRADTLPCEERHGLAQRVQTSYQNMLVFRRELAETAATAPQPPAEIVVDALPPSEPLSEAVATKLANIHTLATPRNRAPRLVSPFSDRGPAPSVGPATAAPREEQAKPPAE
ncbi:MAG: DUF4177 domain-containing protein [Rhodobacteraceae bacterium]|nr:DUF4177 domain-containing protein [Paracoccaceae bacterium]